ncbi:PA14 domain-containing protein [Spirosoma taeanense]|nr:PA14 domain-containing protein [Spirosoma taeanense]
MLVLMAAARAQPGLKGEYYNGTNFERKVLTRIDPQLSFTWKAHSPGPGVDQSYYSVRWTGKLLAPASGRYTFFAKVDDGIRIWVGNQKVMDVWRLNDSKNFTGSVVLQAGHYYDLKIEYFNDMLGGVIDLFWQRPDAEVSVLDRFRGPGEPITARYFRQSAPAITLPSGSVAPAPKVASVSSPEPVRKRPVALVKSVSEPTTTKPPVKKPVMTDQPVASTVVVADVPVRREVAEPAPELPPGETFVLRHVKFEQSSYVLLPESTAELDRLVQTLNKNPQWRIEVAGHTDNVGDPRLNLALSENRAKVVAAYLIRHGIADDRIEPRGYGSTRPVADNQVEHERVKNRRVEITVR